MAAIDRAGTFTGVISESTVGQSAKGFPQWQARLTAERKWASTADELVYYKLAEAAYVPWEPDTVLAYLVLFNDSGPLKNCEQLAAATGWDGKDFADLLNLVGKKILFRVENELYNGKEQLKVNWIDAEDASADRTLKSVDALTIKALNAKFLTGFKKPPVPTKPAASPAKAVALPPNPSVQPAAPSAPAATVPSTPAALPATAEAAVATPAPKTPPARKPKAAPTPAAEPVNDGPPKETTKDAAWEYITTPAIKGTNEDAVVEEAWIAACSEVGPDRDESTFTATDWAKVRDIVVKDLAA